LEGGEDLLVLSIQPMALMALTAAATSLAASLQ
jgi:hypothetical protein